MTLTGIGLLIGFGGFGVGMVLWGISELIDSLTDYWLAVNDDDSDGN